MFLAHAFTAHHCLSYHPCTLPHPQVLRSTTHNGFPVFVQEDGGAYGRDGGAAAPAVQQRWGAGGLAGGGLGHSHQQQTHTQLQQQQQQQQQLPGAVRHVSAYAGAVPQVGFGGSSSSNSSSSLAAPGGGASGVGADDHGPHAVLQPPCNGTLAAMGKEGAQVQGSGLHTAAPHTRLEGFVLRSQLLVLLQRRHFCDARGRPVGRDQCDK